MKKHLLKIISFALALFVSSVFSAGSLTVTAASGTVYESESNNTVSTANVTYDDYDSYGTISSTSDVDWWKVTFSSEGIANFYLGSIPSGCNYELRVYNYTGNTLLVESLKSSNSSELCKVHVRAGEAYYIKIYSTSGYSTTDTYKFRFKRYGLNGARIFTSQHINSGLNQSGANDWNPIISGMGYSSSVLLNKTAAYAYTNMPNYTLVLTNTHGELGGVRFYTSSADHTTLHGNNYTDMPANDRAVQNYSSNSSLSNNVMVLYKACYAGGTGSIYGNLVDMTLTKGAFCSMGWTVKIKTADGNLWVEKFLEYCANGENLGNARWLTNQWASSHQSSFIDYDAIMSQYVGNSRMFATIIG